MTIYTASKTHHFQKWLDLKYHGHNIISTWIYEAGAGASPNYTDLADRCIKEASAADLLLLYCEPGELLSGALMEAGAALAANKRVHCVGECESISRVFKKHKNWKDFSSVQEALRN